MNKKVNIIGAGLAGLITASHFTRGDIVESGSRVQGHKALLRFRDESVSVLTGIPFKKVRVIKAVVNGNQTFRDACPIDQANLYSYKVTGRIGSRSVVKLAEGDRFIAPDDFYDALADRHNSRINWNTPADLEMIDRFSSSKSQTINTAPMPVLLKILGMHLAETDFTFHKQAIKVYRFNLSVPCDVYQTIYFPALSMRTYRASITGRTVIIETTETSEFDKDWKTIEHEIAHVMSKFGILPFMWESADVETVDQKYGKIADIPSDVRRAVIYELTTKHNIFSIGRFACWRNILLDDVAKDIEQVEKLMTASVYDISKFISQKSHS